MSALQLQAYDMLKLKLGEQEAKLFISYIESQVEQELKHETKSLATKDDIIGVKEDMANMKSELMRQIYIVGLIQFLAIVSSVIGIMAFMLQK